MIQLYILAFLDSRGMQQIHQHWADPLDFKGFSVSETIKQILIRDRFYTAAQLDKKHIADEMALQMGVNKPDEFYVVHVEGDVHPTVSTAFDSSDARNAHAGELKNYFKEDGIYQLNMVKGFVSVNNYSGEQMDELAKAASEKLDDVTGTEALDA